MMLIAHNIQENPLNQAVRALVVSLGLFLAIFAVLNWLTKNRALAALMTSILACIFFFYGHLHVFGELYRSTLGYNIFSHRFLLPLCGVVFVLVVWFLRKAQSISEVTNVFNIAAVILLLFPLYQITIHQYRQATQRSFVGIDTQVLNIQQNPDFAPDVYYIILDKYTRADVLQEEFSFDNSAFIQGLEQRGFYVAECSLSNYSTTKFSLTSSLNLQYLDVLFPDVVGGSGEGIIMDAYLQNNFVRAFFERRGYSVVSFQNDFYGTEWRNADYFIEVESSLRDTERLSHLLTGQADTEEESSLASIVRSLIFSLNLSKFEWLLMQTTSLRVVTDYLASQADDAGSTYLDDLRQYYLVKLVLEEAHEAVEIPGPKFYYLHLAAPHDPFVFTATGEFKSILQDEDKIAYWEEGYIPQVEYVNDQMLSLVDKILEHSETPPIIVIQGDHGIPWFGRNTDGRQYQYTEILNAYFLPYGGQTELYDSITPVNSWRLILSEVFDVPLDLLEDRSYSYDVANSPFDHELYEERFAACRLRKTSLP